MILWKKYPVFKFWINDNSYLYLNVFISEKDDYGTVCVTPTTVRETVLQNKYHTRSKCTNIIGTSPVVQSKFSQRSTVPRVLLRYISWSTTQCINWKNQFELRLANLRRLQVQYCKTKLKLMWFEIKTFTSTWILSWSCNWNQHH